MKIEFRSGELGLQFVNKKGEVLMEDTVSFSGPPEAVATVEYPDWFATEKGVEPVIPVCIRVTPGPELKFDGSPPLEAVLARCKKLRCSKSVTKRLKKHVERALGGEPSKSAQ